MGYANPLMLFGLTAALIPVIIHLFTQHRAQRVDWGAMQWLRDSVVHRTRRMLLEQVLLLVVRCLFLAFVALAMAAPFVPPDSHVPWQVVLPALLLGIAAAGTATALQAYPVWRWSLYGGGALLLALAVVAALAERWLPVGLLAKESGRQDVAIIIDGSDSMNLRVDGVTQFERAVDEARVVVAGLRGGDAASIIVAGADMVKKVPTPNPRTDELRSALATAKPCGGTMSAATALKAAAETLSGSENIARKIVVITDGQSVGWKQNNQVNWNLLAEPLKKLTPAPGVVLRQLSMPQHILNASIAGIAVPNSIIGPDRPASIEIRVENTGTEPIRAAFDVELRIDRSDEVFRQPVGELLPREATTVTFHHLFARAGLHALEARLTLKDDLPWDNVAASVIRSFDQLPILMIEGNPTPRFFDRASWFLDVALAPDPSEYSVPQKGRKRSSSDRNNLFALTTIDLPELEKVGDFHRFRVVILCDVPQLSAKTAIELSHFVADGGGLLVVPGSHCRPEFYNHWLTSENQSVLPANLVARRVAAPGHPIHPAIGTIQHPALRLVAENPQSDLGSATVTAYWELKPDPTTDGVRVGAALDNGAPLLLERALLKGRVLMFAVGLDSGSTSLPTLQNFLPLIQELVQGLMKLPGSGMEFDLPEVGALQLAPDIALQGIANDEPPALTGSGLRGEYYAGADFGRRLIERLDSTVSFDWRAAPPAEGVPAADFSVRWTGTLVPLKTGAYTFSLRGDQTDLWINGRHVAVSTAPAPGVGRPKISAPAGAAASIAAAVAAAPAPTPVDLVAGRAYSIRIEHRRTVAQDSQCHVFWASRETPNQAIPAQCLMPQPAWRPSVSSATRVSDEPALAGTLIEPGGARRGVILRQEEGHVIAPIGHTPEPGLYQLELPDAMRDDFQQTSVAGAVPFALRGAADESRLAVLSDEDISGAKGHLELSRVVSTEEMIQALSGQTTGSRVWKYLALAALLLAVGEIALTRWIAVQRRIGNLPKVDFSLASSGHHDHSSRAMEMFTAGGTKPAAEASHAK